MKNFLKGTFAVAIISVIGAGLYYCYKKYKKDDIIDLDDDQFEE